MSAHESERYVRPLRQSEKQIRMTPAEAVRNRPSVLFTPKLSMDGSDWCALYGESLQDGVSGHGSSPEAAMLDFDRNWYKPVSQKYIQKVRERQMALRAMQNAAEKPKAELSPMASNGTIPPSKFLGKNLNDPKVYAQLIAETRSHERNSIIWVSIAAIIFAFAAGFWTGSPTWLR